MTSLSCNACVEPSRSVCAAMKPDSPGLELTSTRRSTRSGRTTANSCAIRPPSERPSTLADVNSAAFITAKMSSVRCCNVGASPKRSERPTPRLSNAVTVTCRAVYSRKRRCTLCSHTISRFEASGGTTNRSGPLPNCCHAMRTPSVSTKRTSGTSTAAVFQPFQPTTAEATGTGRPRPAGSASGSGRPTTPIHGHPSANRRSGKVATPKRRGSRVAPGARSCDCRDVGAIWLRYVSGLRRSWRAWWRSPCSAAWRCRCRSLRAPTPGGRRARWNVISLHSVLLTPRSRSTSRSIRQSLCRVCWSGRPVAAGLGRGACARRVPGGRRFQRRLRPRVRFRIGGRQTRRRSTRFTTSARSI